MTWVGWILCGFCGGALWVYGVHKYKTGGFEKLAQEIMRCAEVETKRAWAQLEIQLKQKEFDHRLTLDQLSQEKMEKVTLREDKIDRQLVVLEKRLNEIEKKERELNRLRQELNEREGILTAREKEGLLQLQRLAEIGPDEAKNLMFEKYAAEVKAESALFLIKNKKERDEEAHYQASQIVATAMNRLTLPTVSDISIVTVALPNQEMKGRLIGREGRNIHALEQATGVNIVIDDTPNVVVISGFDPVRKECAKVALKELIQDGRIHPTRIEEVVGKAKIRVEQSIKEQGERAALQAGSLTFHPEIILLLGKLHFLYSFGQNILAHSIEVSHLMGIMAAELQLDCDRAKRIGLLHDIGKAVSHEVEDSHALVGGQLALKYRESEEVANGIGSHHDESMPKTIEAILCNIANKISGMRPGARLESLEHYVKRSAKLELISKQFEGVEKAYALHAGKELRIIVEPERFDDQAALHLAREIAKKIETELSYQGKIKVTVIREKRSIEYAS